MAIQPVTHAHESRDLNQLNHRLAEAEATLSAIAAGQVDAFVVHGSDGADRVLKLKGEDHPYRVFVETMNDGAVTLLADGTIVYANVRFSEITGRPLEQLIGQPFDKLVTPRDRDRVNELLAHVQTGSCCDELQLLSGNDESAWVQLSVSPVGLGPAAVICMVVADISKQKELERQLHDQMVELKNQNDQIQRASRFKSEFLANMSHELRSPLNGVIGFSELLYDGKLGTLTAEMKDSIGRIHASARHLLELINGVLDLSKIEAGRMEFRPERVVISRLIGEVTEALEALAHERQIRIETEIDPGADEACIDPIRLKEVLFNYLSNALKFTEAGGRIVIALQREGATEFRLEVTDTGIGINDEDLGRLFVEFQQLCNRKTKRFHGTGLGLALTKRIVEAQGGRVGVTSIPGKGSTFFAVLPNMPEPESRQTCAEPACPSGGE